MKYFFVVGERSGDLHASRVIEQLQHLDHNCEVYGWGGKLMENAGAKILRNYIEYSIIGFWEVIRGLGKLHSLLKACKKDISNIQPDVLVLVDFAGFNLRLGNYAKENGVKIAYYIPPKVWAWGTHRINKIKNCVDETLVIFPFEESFFKERGVRAKYVGNPSLESFHHTSDSSKMEQKAIAILPGSRRSEVISSIAIVDELARSNPDLKFLVSKVDSLPKDLYRILESRQNTSLFEGNSKEILSRAEIAVVTSGTATLEAALLGVPQIVVYKTSRVTYLIAKYLVSIPYISLVNILLNRKLVVELIQKEFSSENIEMEVKKLMKDTGRQKKISEGYSEIRNILGDKVASSTASKAIYDLGRS